MNSKLHVYKSIFTSISSTTRAPCFYASSSQVDIANNYFSLCIGLGGLEGVFGNCFAIYGSPKLRIYENSLYKCSPDFYTGCDSSIYIKNSKTYWHCHNASNNGGREGGALGTVEISDDANMKYLLVENPQDSCGFISHSSNNISNLIIHNAHMVNGLVFWAIVHLNIFDSLILNVKSKPLIQDLKKLSLYGTFVQQDSGNIGTNFAANIDMCHFKLDGNRIFYD